MSDPELYRDPEEVKKSKEDLKKIEVDLEHAYARWEELESLG